MLLGCEHSLKFYLTFGDSHNPQYYSENQYVLSAYPRLVFIKQFVETLGQIGYKRLKEIETRNIIEQNEKDLIAKNKIIEESEKKFKDFFDKAADAIFIGEINSGIILDANQAASRLMQMPHDKIVGLHQSQLHPPQSLSHTKETFEQHIQDIIQRDSPIPVENTIIRSDGTEVPVEVLPSKVVFDGKQSIMGTFRDITKRKQTEQNLFQKNADNAFLTSFSFQLADSSSRDIIKDITLPCIKKHTNAVYAHFAVYILAPIKCKHM